MANTNVLITYIFILIMMSFVFTSMGITENKFNFQEYSIIAKMRAHLADNEDIVSRVLGVVMFPLLIIDLLVMLVAILGFTLINVPPIITAVLFAPMLIVVLFDYVLPMLRGN